MAKKKQIILIVSIVSAILIACCVIIPLAINARNNKIIESYTNQNLELYSKLNIISDCAVINKKTHSLDGIKEAVRKGADTVTLDLCFKEDGTPVITDDYTNISDETLKVKDVFALIIRDEYSEVKINFRLRQLITLSVLNDLISEYDVAKRVIISGIDSNRYSLISGTDTAAKVYFDFIPTDDTEDSVKKVTDLIAEYNLSGVIIDVNNATKELVDSLSLKGISYIINNADDEIDLYRIMSYGAYAIETDSPEVLLNAYNSWRDITLKRIDTSILDELNK
ncbi:MAG: hypothetical protein IJZ88_06470 [Clostridia bacterium]|nr:hypothetical protein [Clostridia bacterium]